MASNTRVRRSTDIASKPQPLIETGGDHVSPLPDDNDHSDGREPSNTDYEVNATKYPQGRRPWTPEPEPYDPEKYVAWGRKHYGEDWYEKRKVLFDGQDLLMHGMRQRNLRKMEREIEGRPIEPLCGLLDKGWKQLYAQMSNVLPSVETGSNLASPPPADGDSNDGSEQSNISGYSTYPPTPGESQESPEPEDPWERLEWRRRHWHWTEEEYQYDRYFLKEALIDSARSRREDDERKRRHDEEWGAILRLKWTNNREYERQKENYNLRIRGWTQEQIDASEREAAARWERTKEEREANDAWFRSQRTKEEREASDAWLRRERADLARLLGHQEPDPDPELGIGTKSDAPVSGSIGISRPRVLPPGPQRPIKDISRKTRSGRIAKNTVQRQSVARGDARTRQSAPTHAEAPIRNCLPKRFKEAPDTQDEPLDSTTQPQHQPRRRRRKAYEKERESRRLRGQSPEFGMLREQRKPSSSGSRSSGLSRKPKLVKGAKPQGISKSRKADRPKRPAKRSRG